MIQKLELEAVLASPPGDADAPDAWETLLCPRLFEIRDLEWNSSFPIYQQCDLWPSMYVSKLLFSYTQNRVNNKYSCIPNPGGF